jgi:transposase-like protein
VKKLFVIARAAAFYDLKTPEEKVQRAVHQSLEGLHPEAVARLEGVHPTTVQRWVERASVQAQAADQAVVSEVQAADVEWDERYSFAGVKRPDPEDSPSSANLGRPSPWGANRV